jgi:hypothetical protein
MTMKNRCGVRTARIGSITLLGVALGLASCNGGEEATGPGTGGGAGAGGSGGNGGTAGTGGVGGSGGAAGAATGGSSGASGGASAGTAGAASGAGNGGSAGGGAGLGGSGGGPTGGAGSGGGAGSAGTAGAGSGGGAGASAGCLEFGEPMEVGTIASSELPGPSGIAASRAHAGVIYGHEDAGGMPRFFAFDKTGKTLGEYRLTGGVLTDWEDIAVGPGPDDQQYVFIGDFGDNAGNRSEVQVLKVPEPNVDVAQAAAMVDIATFDVLRFTFPDGANNTETLMVDPVTKDILLVTKSTDGMAKVFRAPGNTPADMPAELELLTTIPLTGSGTASQVSAGDISPTGDRIMLRTYTRILLWPRIAGATIGPSLSAMPTDNPQPDEPQGEGLTFSSDGSSWLAAGEQDKTIYEGVADCP